ncbi:MAG: hypothetical protein RI568_13010 [Natronomonas sp.]|uniref:hypothetical protein n=1 Tax=Natronomonas sp. TaxID=2184060 RepID=UPI0028706191|nr:hypothetical protein [Natronomonas sp.]MDR9431602.1 hypothetical protein [Natronomonas sp.]
MRRIRVTGGTESIDSRTAQIENYLVELLDVSASFGAIVLESFAGGAVVEDMHVRVDDDDVYGIRMKAPTEAPVDLPKMRCERIKITGRATESAAVRVNERLGCESTDLRVSQTGAERNGLEVVRSTGGSIRNSVIDVTGRSLVLEESSMDPQNVTLQGAQADLVEEN